MEPLSPGASLLRIQDYVAKMETQDPGGRIADIGGEAVDTLILLMSIVNRCGINLEDAFHTKEARNETRSWV
jgi:hypothetical protein